MFLFNFFVIDVLAALETRAVFGLCVVHFNFALALLIGALVGMLLLLYELPTHQKPEKKAAHGRYKSDY